MTDLPLPAPLTPPECDLRGYDFMPLFGHRLFRSELYEQTDGEQFKVAVKLWWEAWNQCPAGSLPNDDVKLCRLADLGRDVKAWRRMREAVMRGFVLCSDGRLYHKLLCEWATDAFERRVRDRERKRKWREGRSRDGDGTDGGSHSPRPRDNPNSGQGQPPYGDGDTGQCHSRGDVKTPLTGQERTGQERKEREDSDSSCSGVPAREAGAVVALLGKELRRIAYARSAYQPRDREDQIVALAPPKPRPKATPLTPEQLRAIRETGRRRA